MVQQWMKRILLIATFISFYQHDTVSQTPDYGALRPRQSLRPMFNVTLGLTSPQGHEGLREFWLNGPGGSAEFLIQLNPLFALGVGADMSLLFFDERAFAERWPGIPLSGKQNLFVGNVYVGATYSFLPGRQTRPFVSAQVGAEFITEALYRQVIGGVRYTYYDVGGKTRLALGVAAGASISLDYDLALLVELKGTFINNDPNVGFLAHGRVGLQFKL